MRISTLVGAALAAFTLAMTLHVAQAATITVTTTQDEQAANGQCSLREAVQAANTDAPVDACPAGSGADTIVVPAGIYTLTITGTTVIESAPNLLELTSAITIAGMGRDNTFIQGTGFCNPYWNPTCPGHNRLVYVAPSASVTIRNATLGSNSTSISPLPNYGGGIYNAGDLMLNTMRLSKSAANNGGGIYNTGTLRVYASEVLSNSAFYPFSYVTSMGGGILNLGSLQIESSTIFGNSPRGIFNGENATTVIDSTLIENNNGGGLANIGEAVIRNSIVISNSSENAAGISSSGNLVIANSTITKNTATGGGNRAGNYPGECGGVSAGGYLTMTNSIISFNASFSTTNRYTYAYIPGSAGGVCLFGKAYIVNSAIYSNTAGNGGGMEVRQYRYQQEPTWVRLQNVTLSSNAAYSQSGGLRVIGGVVDLQYSTIASNTAPLGSNVHVLTTSMYYPASPGVLYLHNTLIAGGNGTNCANEAGIIESAGFNLSSDSSCTTLTTTGDITNTDPLLDPLQTNWPGTTPTHALLPGSPAINKGEYVRSDSALTDQRGIFRRWGGAYADIGAYEVFDPSILHIVYLPLMQR